MGIGGSSVHIVADIGINHNGDIAIAKKLIDLAKLVGCDAVKFQKRTIDLVYSSEELAKPRENPFGPTNGDLKRGLEFSRAEYDEIDSYCSDLGIDWYASVWDIGSIDFMMAYDPSYIKIPSPCVMDTSLLTSCISTGKPLLASTGMCNIARILYLADFILMNSGNLACLYHCTSTYPTEISELNLKGIETMKRLLPGVNIGFSGHERGVFTTVMAVVMGAVSVERHITLDRAMWGSDQAASLESAGISRLVRDIRDYEKALGDGEIVIYDSELPIIEKLRRVDDFEV